MSPKPGAPEAAIDRRLKLSDARALGLLIGLIVAAIGLRVVWSMTVNTQPVTDFDWYFTRAQEIAAGLGYQVDGRPTAYWPVGYPAVLALVLAAFGPYVEAAKAFNLFLTVAAVPLTYWVAERLYACRATGLLAALAVAVYPAFVAYAGILAAEPLFAALVLLGTLWLVRSERGFVFALAAGAVFGLAVLVRPQAIVLPFLVLAAARLGDGGDAKRMKLWPCMGAVCAGLLIVLSPWLLRCHQVFGQFVFVSTNGGDNLLIGHHPGADGRYKNPDLAGLDRPAEMGEVQRDKAARRQALLNIQADPLASVRLAPAKLAHTFLSGTDAAYWAFQTQRGRLIIPGRGPREKPLYLALRQAGSRAPWVLVFGALAGLLAGWAAKARAGVRLPALPWLMIAYTALLSVVFFGNPRFLFPVVPFLAMAAACLPQCIGAAFEGRQAQEESSS